MKDLNLARRGLFKTAAASTVLLASGFGIIALDAMSSPARAEGTLDRLRKRGYARIAIANELPFTEVKPDGKVSGAAVELARAVLKGLGIPDVVASVSEYGAMIPGLEAGRFDLVTAGLFMHPDRCAVVLFSEPTLCAAEGLIVKRGNPLKVESFGDIAKNPKVRMGTPGGGTEEKLALEAGTPRDRVIVLPDAQSGITMLQDGRIDVYALPALSLRSLLQKAKDPNLELFTPVRGTPIYCAGAVFRKSDVAFRDAYDKVLAELKKSGEFQRIIEPWGFSAATTAMMTRKELCNGKG